ncbi:hypothetical protein GIB67_010773 [Kingdonia uniflora]|uniref:Interferon-related developmental regulator N-terminal domain-containing protein n=1 Tax=Kingdonia uniflora TaxID=39325 RepID=A0A7J7L8T5_9MAGN|nr:hypothetical protein GIB67_010773 [Kingdonia uniflora]
MGKPKTQRKSTVSLISDEDDDVFPCAPRKQKKSLESCLDDLDLKRARYGPPFVLSIYSRVSKREEALSIIIDGLQKNFQYKFLEKNSITLLHQCLNSIKKGSSKEICLASDVIGLLSITVGCRDNVAHEILEESNPPLLQALKSASESLKVQHLLDCISITTLVGGNGLGDTERSMQIIWEELLQPKSGSNASSPSPQVVIAAISAWSFLLATSDKWNISSTRWKESICYFSNLLKNGDGSVRLAAVEALSLICEIGALEKFSSEKYVHVEGLKENILNQMMNLSVEDNVTKEDLNSEKNLSSEVVRFLKDGYRPQTSIKINGDVKSFSTWSEVTKENELLHEFFKFTPKAKQCLAIDGYDASKVDIHYVYQPELRKGGSVSQRMLKSPNSFLSKAKTQLINKQRAMSEARNGACDAVSFVDEEA